MGNAKSTPKNRTGKSVVRQKLETAQKTNILSLTEHGLEEIPAQVFQLKSLRTLDLSKNKLAALGPLSQLAELKSLNCEGNLLVTKSLAPISQLRKLQSLSVGKNRLHSEAFIPLPSKIKQLKLPNNSLATIPMQICDATLKNLEKIDLSFNNIAAVPAVIGNLTSLSDLNLDSNAITSLPREMGQLKKLKSLSLKNNYISVKSTNFNDANPQPLPAELFTETSLMDLNLHGNKLGSTQLNEFEGFEAFLERRKQSKTKALYGGATTNMSLCGLE